MRGGGSGAVGAQAAQQLACHTAQRTSERSERVVPRPAPAGRGNQMEKPGRSELLDRKITLFFVANT